MNNSRPYGAVRRFIRTGLLVLSAWLLLAAAATAQTAEPQRPFGNVVKEWEATFERIVQDEAAFGLSAERADVYAKQLSDIAAEAQAVKESTRETLKPLEEQLKALGPGPAEGEEPEAPDLAEQRKKIQEEIAFYNARIKQSDLALARADELRNRITAYQFEQSIDRLITTHPYPFVATTLFKAGPEAFDTLNAISRAPAEWWSRLTEDQREWLVLYRVAIVVVLAVVITLLVRWARSRWFRRDPDNEDPTYAHMLATAIADGVANGILPALVFAAFLIRIYTGPDVLTGHFLYVFTGFCWAMILFSLGWAIPRAVLVPDHPAWRLVPVRWENARRISHRITLLAAIFAIDVFLSISVHDLPVSRELYSVYVLVVRTVEALAILFLLPTGLWELDAGADGQTEEAAAEQERTHTSRYWRIVRLLIRLIAVAIIVSALIGYANLSTYLTKSLALSALAVGILFLLRGLLRETIGRILRTRIVQDQLHIPHETRNRYKFWLRGILDVGFQLGGLLLIIMIWGVPAEDVLDWTSQALQKITIGDVSISIVDILVSLAIFAVAMTITRILQRTLNERVFPQTRFDVGVRNSLSSGLGYVGLAIAIALAVSAMGLDLSNLALIAGALSVGIGFGLQNVVNNFVSGLILLVERPIKVGDWILVGGHEGYVKQIKVRATEIETFQRASVIIPNSELISSAVINWTHKDAHGRVEVPIGVAYGSDVNKVMEVLQKCLVDNPTIMTMPEPFVLFMGFGDSSLDFEARGYIPDISRVYRIGTELRVAIYNALAEAGIEIPFPQRDVHIKSLPPGIRSESGSGPSA